MAYDDVGAHQACLLGTSCAQAALKAAQTVTCCTPDVRWYMLDTRQHTLCIHRQSSVALYANAAPNEVETDLDHGLRKHALCEQATAMTHTSQLTQALQNAWPKDGPKTSESLTHSSACAVATRRLPNRATPSS
jgi:hypothetical protein